jgi:phage tail sheath gpL-like
MAALTTVELIKRLPIGDRFIKTFRATSNATASTADEYIKTGLSWIDAVVSWVPIGQSALSIAATGTVTFIPTDPTDEDKITVDGIVYTIQAGALSNYDVALSTTEATMAANFAAAINRNDVQGSTKYASNIAAHPTVKASVSTAVVTLTARVPGAAGNAITLTTNSTGATVSGATLTGGADGVAAGIFRKNASGTVATEGANAGNLGIEFAAPSVLFEITVIGKP